MDTYYVNLDSAGGDGTTNETSGATAAFSSSSAAEAALDDAALTDDTEVLCCGGSDSTPITITIDTDIYSLTWAGNPDHEEGAHEGIYDYTKYGFFDDGDQTLLTCNNASTANVTFKKLQFRSSFITDYRNGLYVSTSSGDNIIVDSCIGDFSGSSSTGNSGIYVYMASGKSAIVKNNIVQWLRSTSSYSFYSSAVSSDSILSVNNTGYYGTVIFNSGYGDTIFKNNAAFDVSSSCFSYGGGGGGGTGSDYNLDDDGSAPGGNSIQTSQAKDELWTDPDNDDFTVADEDSDLYDNGVGPGADGDIPTLDIVGNTRSGNTCDIGAFEYVAAGTSIPIFMHHYNTLRGS